MRCILYSYNKVSQRRENVIKKLIRKRRYIYSTMLYLSVIQVCCGLFTRWIICWKGDDCSSDLSLWYRSSNSTFPCNDMTSLCFLGAHPASLVIFHMHSIGLWRVYGIALNMMKIHKNFKRSPFSVIKNWPGRGTAHGEMISITLHILLLLLFLDEVSLCHPG